ncbi:patatin-like phospholipase family protein [Rhodanobacter sp. 7MK24]|uniref:patatin-like phospholipase family protein n=1 Tax=Rhodanobacter sp. 7MK24 TaxID=2775922 RepID=UPI00177DE77C|nr:patatin-like phospholipase family protein [Rhodanobacter sp. 7MK24]MBD8881643.1 patatin-like phospholipase family protein [Rhodanobacter sp. 7MK24]
MQPTDLADLIRRTAIFAHLDEFQLEMLARRMRWLCLPGGQYLFEADEPSEALYLLRSGSLGVFDGPSTLMHQLAAGDCVGEISLLSGGNHHLSVRALRDSELLRLDVADFEAMVERHPTTMLAVARTATLRLLQNQHRVPSPNRPRTFAMLPAHRGVPVRELAQQLATAMEPYGHCTVIDAELGRDRGSDWFAEREAWAQFVLYLDDDSDPEWRQRCLRQADALLLPALAAQAAQPWTEFAPGHPARTEHRPRHLLLLHERGEPERGSAQRWRAPFSGPLMHHHICGKGDIERVARLVTGHARGLVLAGGGARGLAHLGAIKALRDAGHAFDAVGGTSIGAIIGAGVAHGWDTDTMLRRYFEAFVRSRPLSDWTLPLVALTRGRRASHMLREAFGDSEIEDLGKPFFCVSTNLSGAGRAVHRTGPLWLWLRASSAIPGVLPPVLHRGEVHVDGALVDNLPTDVMATDGIAHLTALSIHGGMALRAGIDDVATPPWWRLLLQQHRGPRWPGLVSTLARAAMVNSEETSERCRALAHRLIVPPLERVGLLEWKSWRRAVDAGYRETLRVLEAERKDREPGCDSL